MINLTSNVAFVGKFVDKTKPANIDRVKELVTEEQFEKMQLEVDKFQNAVEKILPEDRTVEMEIHTGHFKNQVRINLKSFIKEHWGDKAGYGCENLIQAKSNDFSEPIRKTFVDFIKWLQIEKTPLSEELRDKVTEFLNND